jgi:PST family polysaccharide transporter
MLPESTAGKDMTARPDKRLGRFAARGALVTMAGQACRILLQFGGIIVLARLLSPGDYGLLAMVIAIIGIGDVLRDFGLSAAAIQADSVSPQQRSNLFWINSLIGLALAVAAYAAAPWIARFYDQPLLVPIARALAITFVLKGLATQYRAQLNRDMRFGALSAVEIGGQGIGLATGVALALQGYGYWALVMQGVAHAATTLVLLLALTRWCPGLPRRGAAMGNLLRYGWNLMNMQLIAYLSRNVDALVIGHRFGAESLGLYNRAYQLLMLPLDQINAPATTIALPVLSRIKGDRDRYSAFLLHGQAALLHAVVAVFTFACAQAEPLILLVLGSQWAPAVPLFQILAVGGVFQAAGHASYWVFLSKGLTGSQLRYVLTTRIVIIGAVLVGANWGALGVATAFSVALAVKWWSGLFWLRNSGAPVGIMFRNGVRMIAVYGGCGLVSALASSQLAVSMSGRLAVGTVAMCVAFGAVCAAWPWFRENVAAIVRTWSLLR